MSVCLEVLESIAAAAVSDEHGAESCVQAEKRSTKCTIMTTSMMTIVRLEAHRRSQSGLRQAPKPPRCFRAGSGRKLSAAFSEAADVAERRVTQMLCRM